MIRVGFIGLGEQGKPLAINVALGGFGLMVRDLRAEPVDELVSKDLALALELGHELGIDLPAAALVQQRLDEILGAPADAPSGRGAR
jgi:3-hydroxyisobutyrate dehydrogenase-like beta-hydroxyacid dehydrogenase